MSSLKLCGEIEGCPVYEIVLRSEAVSAHILSYGAVLQRLFVRDQHGAARDVVLGFDDWREYVDQAYYLGCTIGRVCNRITGARYTLDRQVCLLDANEGNNHLHGGRKGFWNRPWQVRAADEQSVVLGLHSPDGDMGYAGALDCTVQFSLKGAALTLTYQAYAYADTPVSLTNHTYFNLSGQDAGDCLSHRVEILADSFCEIDSACASTGTILPVAGTALDLRQDTVLSDRLPGTQDPQLLLGSGYNHNYVLRSADGLRPAARVWAGDSGISMEVRTDRPGMHFYAGNYLDHAVRGKGDILYPRYGGLCFETQMFPDAIHFPQFPSPILHAGESSVSTTVFDFT